MYIKNGIAYAGEETLPLRICGVRALPEHLLWLRFTTGEAKVFDFKPHLDAPCFRPLKDEDTFRDVYIDYGCPVWLDGRIDIAPEYLYENSVSVGGAADE